jgi:hypothetical protein
MAVQFNHRDIQPKEFKILQREMTERIRPRLGRHPEGHDSGGGVVRAEASRLWLPVDYELDKTQG